MAYKQKDTQMTTVDVRSMQQYRAALRKANTRNDDGCVPSTLSSVRVFNLTSKDLLDTCIEVLQMHSGGVPLPRRSKDEVSAELTHDRMGATPASGACVTCGRGWESCPGHGAVLRVYRLVLIPTYAKHIVKILNSIVCYHRGVAFPAMRQSRSDSAVVPVGCDRDGHVFVDQRRAPPRYTVRANGSGRFELAWNSSRAATDARPRGADAAVRTLDVIRTLVAYEAVHGVDDSQLKYWIAHAIPILPAPMRPKAGDSGTSPLTEMYKRIATIAQDVYFPNAMTHEELGLHTEHKISVLHSQAIDQHARDAAILDMFAEAIVNRTPVDDANALARAFTKIVVMILSFETRSDYAARRMCAVYDAIVAKNKDAGPLMSDSPIFDSMVPGGVSIGSQYHDLLLFNKDSQASSSNASLMKRESGLIVKLGGKMGMFRNEGVSKRILHFARTTISPASEISSLSVNVPESTFNTITVKFICTPDVLAKAKRLLKEGELVMIDHQGVLKKISHGRGACATRACGTCVSCVERLLQSKTDSTNWLIYFRRKLREGDRVIVNRQPSLSKRSIQGLTVVRDNRSNTRETMRLPVWIADAFNADYDGDEMNMVFPETVMADAEMMFLMHNQTNWQSTMTPLQDSVFGLFLLGRDSMRLTKTDMSRVMTVLVLFGYRGGLPSMTEERTYTGFDVLHSLFDTTSFRVDPCIVFPGLPPRVPGVPTRRTVPCGVELVLASIDAETFCGISGRPSEADRTWGWGRTATPVMAVPFVTRLVERHETRVNVSPYTLLVFGSTGDAFFIGHKDGSISFRGVAIEYTVSSVDHHKLLYTSDVFLVVRCADGALLSVTGDVVCTTNAIVRVDAVPTWTILSAQPRAAVCAGDVHIATDANANRMHVRLCVASFPVNKKTLKRCKTFFSWYDDNAAVRMLDLFAAIGMLISDMRGASLSYDDFRIDTPHMRRSASDTLRMIQAHADDVVNELKSGEYKQHVPVNGDAYTTFCKDFISFVYAVKNGPTQSCEWTDLKLFTNGSLSKGDPDKLHEMSCMAGVRDIGGSFPFGTLPRSTHYHRERGDRWIANERGVIEPAYLDGVPANAFFYEYNSARTNMAKSHLDIKSTGYNTRKMACAMVDLVCNYRGAVEDCGRIVLFSTPLFNPEFGSKPVDIRAVCASAQMLESPRALTDAEILNGFLDVTKPHHQHLGRSYATTFFEACSARGCSLYMRTSLYYKVRKLLMARAIQPGFPLGPVASADINQSVTQSTLDAFHSTAGDATVSMGAKSILEQRKFVFPSSASTRDTMSKARIYDVETSVCFKPPASGGGTDAWKARILKLVKPRMLSDVIASMSVVYHPWLTTLETDNSDFEWMDGHSDELWSMMDFVLTAHGGERCNYFGSTVRFETRPGLCLRDVYAIHKCLETTFCTNKAQCVLFWKHPMCAGDVVVFRLCIRIKAKAQRRAAAPTPAAPPSKRMRNAAPESDSDSDVHAMASSDDSSQSESESSSSESDASESTDSEADEKDEAVVSEDDEEEEPEQAHVVFNSKSRTNVANELEAFDMAHRIVMCKPYMSSVKSPMSRYIKAKMIKGKTFQHDVLDKTSWSGLPLVGSAMRFSDVASNGMVKLTIPDCRIETLLRSCLRDMVIETIESTHHGNNTLMFGIEIATRLMRKSLRTLWPNMPPLYIFLLVEHVSFTGRILSVNNHGVMQEKGPFNQLCFEKSAEYLLKGEERKEHLDSHVARTFFGMPVKGGTGLPEVYAF